MRHTITNVWRRLRGLPPLDRHAPKRAFHWNMLKSYNTYSEVDITLEAVDPDSPFPPPRPKGAHRFRTYLINGKMANKTEFEHSQQVEAVVQDYDLQKRVYVRLRTFYSNTREAQRTVLQLRVFDNNPATRPQNDPRGTNPVINYEIDFEELFTNENGPQVALFQALAEKNL